MATTGIAFICGLIFGAGLMVSGMARPDKVLNFLDLFGSWDPSLLLVMVAALVVSGTSYSLARQRTQPILAAKFQWPTKTDLDWNLTSGSVLFGIGWGLVGFCPGPALVNLATLSPQVIVFVAAMAAGMILHDYWSARRAAAVLASADG